jgi:hypothetical protein
VLLYIATSLSVNNMLTNIDLGHNVIRNAGAIAIANSIAINPMLLCIDLDDNKIKKRSSYVSTYVIYKYIIAQPRFML